MANTNKFFESTAKSVSRFWNWARYVFYCGTIAWALLFGACRSDWRTVTSGDGGLDEDTSTIDLSWFGNSSGTGDKGSSSTATKSYENPSANIPSERPKDYGNSGKARDRRENAVTVNPEVYQEFKIYVDDYMATFDCSEAVAINDLNNIYKLLVNLKDPSLWFGAISKRFFKIFPIYFETKDQKDVLIAYLWYLSLDDNDTQKWKRRAQFANWLNNIQWTQTYDLMSYVVKIQQTNPTIGAEEAFKNY